MSEDRDGWIWLDPETLKQKQREKTVLLRQMLERLAQQPRELNARLR